MVIDMPEMDEDSVLFVLRQHFPDGKKSALKAFAGLFLVIYALSDFLIMILSWLVKQSLRAFLFQEVQP